MIEARRFTISDFLAVAIAFGLLFTFFATEASAEVVVVSRARNDASQTVKPGSAHCSELPPTDCSTPYPQPQRTVAVANRTYPRLDGSQGQSHTALAIIAADCPNGQCAVPRGGRVSSRAAADVRRESAARPRAANGTGQRRGIFGRRW